MAEGVKIKFAVIAEHSAADSRCVSIINLSIQHSLIQKLATSRAAGLDPEQLLNV